MLTLDAKTVRLALVLAACCVGAAARAQDASATSGLAVGAGVGYQSPVLGGQVDYYWLPEGSPVHFAAHLGAGWVPPSKIGSAQTDGALGLAGGAFAFVGHHHRALLDVSYGLTGTQAQVAGSTVLRQERSYGITAAAGYEYMSSGGFLIRATVGASFIVGDIYVPDQSRIVPTISLAVGWKLM